MKTKDEWISYFRSIGMDAGDIWHLMDGLYALKLVAASKQRDQANG